jgi:hypothetical protein
MVTDENQEPDEIRTLRVIGKYSTTSPFKVEPTIYEQSLGLIAKLGEQGCEVKFDEVSSSLYPICGHTAHQTVTVTFKDKQFRRNYEPWPFLQRGFLEEATAWAKKQ